MFVSAARRVVAGAGGVRVPADADARCRTAGAWRSGGAAFRGVCPVAGGPAVPVRLCGSAGVVDLLRIDGGGCAEPDPVGADTTGALQPDALRAHRRADGDGAVGHGIGRVDRGGGVRGVCYGVPRGVVDPPCVRLRMGDRSVHGRPGSVRVMASADRSILWVLENVAWSEAAGWRLRRVSGTLVGPVAAVMGASGAGKSSLLELLVEFAVPTAGRIEHRRREANRKRRDGRVPLFWVPQQLALWPQFTVEEQLRLVQPVEAGSARAAARRERLLEIFELTSLRNARPEALSGGEAARAALARGVAAEPEVLVVDEPLVNVAPVARERYWAGLMTLLEESGTALVFASHDPDPVLRYADHVLCLDDGTSAFAGTVQELYHRPPTRHLAGFLGAFNWWEPWEIPHWFPGEAAGHNGGGLCLRPEQLDVQACPGADVLILAVRAVGGLWHLTVRRGTATRALVVARHPRQPALAAGMTVELIRADGGAA
ncbi:MAG: ATP-binding cassette domain-containing protein [Planctomycetota bacterium]|nr:MAG: ATP-binding cassette domain-containing protein [Planctomycetota bacterium]